MNKTLKFQTINIGKRDESIAYIDSIKSKRNNFEIKIRNFGLTSLNEICKQKVFKQELAFINASTLRDIMKPSGSKNEHNSHNLSPTEIVDTLRSVKNCSHVYYSEKKPDIFILVSSIIADCGDPIIVIIEINATLQCDKTARINKIITMYPKRRLTTYLSNLTKK